MEFTVEQMKQIEHNADAMGLSYARMMEHAGTAAARILQREWAPETVAVFCGTGNNGGDGYVLARILKESGAQVRIIPVGGTPRTADAAANYEKALALGIPMEAEEGFVEHADAVVDAICGTGFHGRLRPEGEAACGRINAAPGKKLALDLPSGLEADTGAAADGSVRADLTVTFHGEKPCHRLNPQLCGVTETASIGIEDLEREFMEQIGRESAAVITELVEAAGLRAGDLMVIGCSSSEMVGCSIGKNSSMDAALAAFMSIYPVLQEKGIRLAVQCCEHLNRALIVEAETARAYGYEQVNVRPQPKAGGSFATVAWHQFAHPVAVEHVKAAAGLDIGGTMIGMHLKEVAVPLRLSTCTIGRARILCARTRPKFIGGSRAFYVNELM